jgi:holliday junction DNA helicase RuvB
VIDKGPYAKTIKFALKQFTLIGATTRSGLLSSPLRSRFGLLPHLDFYSTDDLVHILQRSADILGVQVEGAAARSIAERSRGTPRIVNRLLRRVRDYAQVKADGKITYDVAQAALEAQGVDRHGLDPIDRKVLKIIVEQYGGGPVGIEALAASLNEEVDTIVDVVEPYLLSIGFLKRTGRGRQVTSEALQYVQELRGSVTTALFSEGT